MDARPAQEDAAGTAAAAGPIVEARELTRRFGALTAVDHLSFSIAPGLSSGNGSYLDFLTPGILAQSVLFVAIFFASNAIYPIAIMPPWLRATVRLNPLSYQVDALRGLMLSGGHSEFGLPLDLAALVGGLVVFVVIATRMYPRLTQ